MKKPTRTTRAPRSLKPAELARTRGGASDDWEAPVVSAVTGQVWADDWLAPT